VDEYRISERISVIPGTENPLSADVGVIQTPSGCWLYDVGNGATVAHALPPCIGVVLSHFHPDHVGNIGQIRTAPILLSNETQKHLHRGRVLQNEARFEHLHAFLLPSSHAKGCVALEVEDTFVFVGDALYGKIRPDGVYVNPPQLLAQIRLLQGLRATVVLESHRMHLPRSKAEVLAELTALYISGDGNAEIRVK